MSGICLRLNKLSQSFHTKTEFKNYFNLLNLRLEYRTPIHDLEKIIFSFHELKKCDALNCLFEEIVGDTYYKQKVALLYEL